MEPNKVTQKNKFEETMKIATIPANNIDWINGSNQVEQNKVVLMRAIVEKQDPSCKDLDDFMLRRFLRACDLDTEKASAMIFKYLKWRRSFVPNGLISATEVPNEIAQDKFFTQGLDKKGRPIAVILGARHFQNKVDPEESKRFTVFGLDKLSASIPAGQEKFVFIADLGGWGYSNSDVRGYLAALSILQDYYPERLGKLYIVHAPRIFMAAWKVIGPLIDENTKKKIVFVENRKMNSTLLEDIDESQLPEIYGGKLKLVAVQDS